MGEDAALSALRCPLHLLAVVGTRPEAVKLAPLAVAARAHPDVDFRFLDSGQHPKEMLEVLEYFGLEAEGAGALYTSGRTLADTTARALQALEHTLAAGDVDILVVQGDTTTAFAAALAGFYARVPVAHVEAGLRTHHPFEPFPEEMNRRLIDALATYLFPPTPGAASNLAAEGFVGPNVFTTGNTIVDALHALLARGPVHLNGQAAGFGDVLYARRVLVTAHRRESWGEPLDAVAAAVARLGERNPDTLFLLPLHPNPVVRRSFGLRRGPSNVAIVDPLPYAAFVTAVQIADLVVTDSGGVLEEATALGTPVLILRDRTERPEALDAGARLIGLDADTVVARVEEALAHSRRGVGSPAFGDGKASDRIIAWLRWRAGLQDRAPAPFAPAAAPGQAAAIRTWPKRTAASSS